MNNTRKKRRTHYVYLGEFLYQPLCKCWVKGECHMKEAQIGQIFHRNKIFVSKIKRFSYGRRGIYIHRSTAALIWVNLMSPSLPIFWSFHKFIFIGTQVWIAVNNYCGQKYACFLFCTHARGTNHIGKLSKKISAFTRFLKEFSTRIIIYLHRGSALYRKGSYTSQHSSPVYYYFPFNWHVEV